MKIFDNPGIFSNASTIPADSISVVNAVIVENVSENAEIAGIAGIAGMLKIFIFWLIVLYTGKRCCPASCITAIVTPNISLIRMHIGTSLRRTPI